LSVVEAAGISGTHLHHDPGTEWPGEPQSFLSESERGERRLDIVELRAFCRAMGVIFVEFVSEFDRRVEGGRGRN
jgi:hypothetical protein